MRQISDTMTEQSKKSLDKAFANAIESMDCGRGRHLADLFDEFLDLALTMLCGNPNDRQKELWNQLKESPKRNDTFAAALQAYGEAAEQDYHDPLGDFFMENVSHGHNGQFFTPEHICEMMAKITNPMKETISDPCCGSGRLPLAGLREARSNGVDPFIYANDISYTCARMTLMNLLFNSARGEVTCGDSLLLDYNRFTFFKIDRVLLGTRWVSTYWQYTLSDVDEVDKKRNEWMRMLLENGMWVETAQPSTHNEECVSDVEEIIDTKPLETELPPLTTKPKVVQMQLELEF